jgi:hypothetical protein
MPNKKENVKKIFGQIIEPFALGVLALLFIIPVITVMNLTPLTQQLKKLDILGVTTEDSIKLTLVEGKHEIFTSETLNKIDEDNYTYSVILNKRASDNYSKPIIEIENKSSEEKLLTFFGQTLTNTRSNISLILNEKSYRIQNSKGETYNPEIVIAPEEKIILFLSIENLSGIQFSEEYDMDINISPYVKRS